MALVNNNNNNPGSVNDFADWRGLKILSFIILCSLMMVLMGGVGFAATPQLTQIASDFDGMSYIIQYLPFFMIIITLIVGIILYSKIQIPSGGV